MGDKIVDALGDDNLDHAVFHKENRIQIIVNPTKKQLRSRGKRGWKLAHHESKNGAARDTGKLNVEIERLVAEADKKSRRI